MKLYIDDNVLPAYGEMQSGDTFEITFAVALPTTWLLVIAAFAFVIGFILGRVS